MSGIFITYFGAIVSLCTKASKEYVQGFVIVKKLLLIFMVFACILYLQLSAQILLLFILLPRLNELKVKI